MSKPARTYQEQLEILKGRGLLVPNESIALHILEHHNYYRLSAYRLPFTAPGNPDQFLPGVAFEQIWQLYQFDRRLRQLVQEGCKKIEVSVRARWAYEVGHGLSPLAYLDATHFGDAAIHAKTLGKLKFSMERGHEDFIRHHRKTLQMPWPPAWVLTEVMSFGNIASLLQQLKAPALRQRVADTYQLDEKIFCSLVNHLATVRNTAAHHARLWNRKFVFTFPLPRKKPAHLFPNFQHQPSRKIYNALVLMVHLVRLIEPDSTWPRRLRQHLAMLDTRLLPDMDVPANWQTLPIWLSL